MSIYIKLNEFRGKVGAIKKDKKNPHFKSSFADINSIIGQIEPVMVEVKIGYFQTTLYEDNKSLLETTIYDLEDDSNRIFGLLPLVTAKPNDPQGLGSSLTYMRRYALVTMLGLEVTDDDGRLASKPQKVDESIKEDDIKMINDLINITNTELNGFLNFFSITKVEDLRSENINKAITMLKKKAK